MSSDNWKNTLRRIDEFIQKHNRLPRKHPSDKIKITKELEYEKKLGDWISHQKENYKNVDRSLSDVNLRKIWENFVGIKYKKYFEERIITINSNNWMDRMEQIVTKMKNINDEEKKKLKESYEAILKNKKGKLYYNSKEQVKYFNAKEPDGRWLKEQYQKYQNNEKPLDDKITRKIFEKFVNISIVKDFFKEKKGKYDEDSWYDKLNQIIEYINENGTLPSDANDKSRPLRKWIRTQHGNYKAKKQIMEMENIRNDWKKFVIKYDVYDDYE